MFTWHDTTWMWVSMLIFWAGIALLVVYAMKAWGESLRRPTSAGHHRATAVDLLDERFARGEISVEEYRDRRRTLGQPADPPASGDPATR